MGLPEPDHITDNHARSSVISEGLKSIETGSSPLLNAMLSQAPGSESNRLPNHSWPASKLAAMAVSYDVALNKATKTPIYNPPSTTVAATSFSTINSSPTATSSSSSCANSPTPISYTGAAIPSPNNVPNFCAAVFSHNHTVDKVNSENEGSAVERARTMLNSLTQHLQAKIIDSNYSGPHSGCPPRLNRCALDKTDELIQGKRMTIIQVY